MRTTRIAFVLAACAMAATASAQGTTGWSYATRITIDSGTGKAPLVMTTRHQISGDKIRTEFTTSAGMPGAEGSYMIYNGADTTMTMVMPGQHMAMITPLDLASAMRMQRMAIKSTNSDVTDLGPGEAILGHATHRYRVAAAGTIEFTIAGQTCAQKFDGTSEIWLAPDVDVESAMAAQLKGMSAMAPLEMVNEMYGSARSRLPKGSSLRTVATTRHFDAAGNPTPVTTTMELTELSHGALPDSAFSIPAGYTTENMREMMKAVPAGMMDSIMKATSERTSKHICDGFGQK